MFKDRFCERCNDKINYTGSICIACENKEFDDWADIEIERIDKLFKENPDVLRKFIAISIFKSGYAAHQFIKTFK